MSKQSEKIFKELNNYLSENKEASFQSKEELEKMIGGFISQHQSWGNEITEDNAESSDDFLELAEYATSKKSAMKYAKKAVELDPDNIDAAAMVAELSASSAEKLLEKYRKLIEETEKKLKSKGYFGEESIGEFWSIFETRPYMRLLDKYAEGLVQSGKMRLAIQTYEKMLKLCENDNLGARYRLMHLYTFLEDEQSALRLLDKYPEEESTPFLLPMSILYYKLGNLTKSVDYLKRLFEINKDSFKFFKGIFKGDLLEDFENESPFSYRPYTIEEFVVETEQNVFLFETSSAYFEWAWQKIKTKGRP